MTTSASVQVSPLVEAVRALAPQIGAYADEIEQARTLPPALVQALAEAGLFRMYTPRALGGSETDPLTVMEVVEEISKVDGSAGWCVLIANQCQLFSASLDAEPAAEIFGDPSSIVAGAVRPVGEAVVADGGYRVSGRWAFASGCPHATWLLGNCHVLDGDTPHVLPDGSPEIRAMFFPSTDCEILDTWQSLGLRGSGSHDFAVRDVFVPRARSFRVFQEPPRYPGPLYRLPVFNWQVQGSHALGIACHAIEALVDLAHSKTPARSAEILRARSSVQFAVAHARALVGSARAYLYGTTRAIWETYLNGEEPAPEQRMDVRLAAAHAATSAREAVDLMFRAAGSSSVYAKSPLERCFRDINTAAEHLGVGPQVYEGAGRLYLGLEPGDVPY